MILNSLLVSPQIPPPDLWLAGYPLSYYYGGYFCLAQLAHVTNTLAATAYNLGLISGYTTSFVTAYGLFWELTATGLKKPEGLQHFLWSLGGACILLVASNGAGTILALEHISRVSPTSWLRVLSGSAATGAEHWWWWAGRAFTDQNIFGRLPEMITEFPIFSFLLGDLHPHLMALPYVLLALGAAVEVSASASDQAWWHISICWMMPMLLGALGWINAWDMPIYILLTIICYGIFRLSGRPLRTLKETAGFAAYLALSFLLFLPFFQTLTTQVKGIGITYYTKTSLGQLLLTFGMLLVPTIVYLVSRKKLLTSKIFILWWVVFMLAPWLGILLIGSAGRALLTAGITMLRGPWVILILSGICAAAAASSYTKTESNLQRWIALLSLVGCILLYLCEFFYIADVFNSRMNTYFKLSYQAWILLATAAMLSLQQLTASRRTRWLAIAAATLLGLSCVYAPLTALSLADFSHHPSLDGETYVREHDAEEYGAIIWLREHATPAEIMVEAVSPDYSSGNRVSASSGVPTLLGWPGHERQWRGSWDIVRERRRVVETIYTCTDQARLLELLHAYRIKYMYVSSREMVQYSLDPAHVAWLGTFLQPVYASEDTILFLVP